MRIQSIEIYRYSDFEISCSFSYPIQLSITSYSRTPQTIIFPVYMKNVISQLLSGKKKIFELEVQWVMLWISFKTSGSSSGVRYGRSAGLTSLIEENNSWSPTR